MDGGNNTEAVSAVTFGTGPAVLARAEGGGPALQISSGGLKYNVSEVYSSTISTRATVYNIISGGPTYTMGFGSDGDTIIAFNGTGSGITIDGISLDTDETRQLVFVGGAWRGL